jgi:hypothetical protein
MRIRFTCPAVLRREFQPGEEIVVRDVTPEITALLTGTRLDGQTVAQIVSDVTDDGLGEEVADAVVATEETRRGARGRGQTLSR